MFSRRTVLALLGALGPAGCLRLSQGSTTTPEPTATPEITPTASPSTSSPTDTPDTKPPTAGPEYPPGVRPDGLSPIIADAHTAALADRSFTARLRVTEAVRGEQHLDATTRFRDGNALRSFNAQQASLYSTAGESLWRREIEGGYIYGTRQQRLIDRGVASYNGFIRGLVDARTFESVTRTVADDQVRFEATASVAADAAVEALPWWLAQADDEIASFSADITVRSGGLVESVAATIEVVRPNDRLRRLELSFGVEGVGSTSVPAPSWLQTARDNVPQIDAALIDGRRFLRLDHTGGVAIPTGAQIDIHGESEAVSDHVENEAPIGQGDRVWLWRDQDTVHLDRGSQPSVTPEPLDATGWLEIQYGIAFSAFAWTLYRVDFQDL